MNKKIFALFIFSFLINFSFLSASTNGTFIGNTSNNLINNSAEFEVIADISATEYWAEVWLNTSKIDLGRVVPGKSSEEYRQKYKIRARGNVNINVVPSLATEDVIFSNLYFSRTFTNWEKIGDYFIKFNLTQNEGYWSTVESAGLENATSSNGVQSIKLDLSKYSETIPFTIENYLNTVKFVIIPDWSSVQE